MPTITIDGTPYEAEEGRRLVLAIEDSGVEIGHRCGGKAKCTTCRIQFVEGEPETMTEAEYKRLNARGLYGEARLSCQIVCDHDMSVVPLVTTPNMPEWNGDTGPTPAEIVEPEPVWYPIEELERLVEQES